MNWVITLMQMQMFWRLLFMIFSIRTSVCKHSIPAVVGSYECAQIHSCKFIRTVVHDDISINVDNAVTIYKHFYKLCLFVRMILFASTCSGK